MDRLTAMQVFVEIADRGSLTAAGKALHMSRAMVSRHLESLELWLGIRLLHRTTRRVSLTDAGTEALQGCRHVLSLTAEVQAEAGARQHAPSGRLRMGTSASFAHVGLAPVIASFLDLYPRVEIQLLAQERAANMVEDRIDLAVRISNQLDDSLVARRLGVCHSVVCAAPAYLAAHGAPSGPEDLRNHRCVTHTHVGRTELRLLHGGQLVKAPVRGVLETNDATLARLAALRGVGIALLPTYLVSADVIEGRLVPVLPGYLPEPMGIHAVYLSRQHRPSLLRLMLDHMTQHFAGRLAPWDQALVDSGHVLAE